MDGTEPPSGEPTIPSVAGKKMTESPLRWKPTTDSGLARGLRLGDEAAQNLRFSADPAIEAAQNPSDFPRIQLVPRFARREFGVAAYG